MRAARNALFAGALVFLARAVCAQALEPDVQPVKLEIASQPLGEALSQFAQQTGLQLVYHSRVAKGLLAPKVVGVLEPAVALGQLLEKSGLRFEFVDGDTVGIFEEENKEPVTSQAVSAPKTHLRFSQAQAGSGDAAEKKEDSAQLEEIVVTGTHIRGSAPVGSKLFVIDKSDIDESGYATLQDVLKQLPQNFGGGVSEDGGGLGNFNRGSSVNLRGLGPGSTLVLIDGHRQPPSGTLGDFVDISTIPVAAVQKIEMLPDGASAIYGSDAIGGVVNIILRNDYQGAETRVRLSAAGGGVSGKQFSQLLGTHWDSGQVMIGYQYDDRDALASAARRYAVNSDKRPLGGDDWSAVYANPGNILDFDTLAPVFAVPRGQNGASLTASDLIPAAVTVNHHNLFGNQDLLPRNVTNSGFLAVSQALGGRVRLSLEGNYSKRNSDLDLGTATQLLFVTDSNPFFVDPFGLGFVYLGYDFGPDLGVQHATGSTETYSASAGLDVRIGNSWQLRFMNDYGRSQMHWRAGNFVDQMALFFALNDSNPATAFNPFGDGSNTNPATLAGLRTFQMENARSDVKAAHIVADGPLFDFPAGAARLALGLDYREESLATLETTDGGATFATFSQDRNLMAGFGELIIPVSDREGTGRGPGRLELSLAARVEHYNDFGRKAVPKIGINWSPLRDLKLRTNWAKSFKAPRLVSLDEGSPANNFSLLAPLVDGSGTTLALVRFGGNQDLQPETARTWTAGFELTPASYSGLALSATYYSIDFQDRILQPGPASPFEVFAHSGEWTSIIDRNPSAGLIAGICAQPTFIGSPADCTATPPAAIVDFRLRNFASVQTRGIDFDLRQSWEARIGTIALGFSGNYSLRWRQSLVPGESTDVLGSVGNPPKWKARGSASWTQGPWFAQAALNYAPGYRGAVGSQRRVDSFATADAHLSYRLADRSGPLNGSEISLSAVNIFDSDPPFVNGVAGYDVANADPLGRILSVQLSKSF